MTEARHKYRPSSLGRLSLCPGSAKMSEGVDGVESEDAAEGTLLHKADRDAEAFSVLTEEQREAVEACTAYCKDLLSIHGEPEQIHWEFPISLVEGEETVTAGTADWLALYYGKGLAILVDKKFGRQEIPDEPIRMQLMAYAAGVLSTFGSYGIRKVQARAFQPRCAKQYRFDLTLGDLPGAAAEIRQIIAKCEAPEMILRPSPEACIRCYCPALSRCPAAKALADNLPAKIEAEDLAVAPIAKLAHWGEVASVHKKFCESVLSALKARVMEGEDAPGWKVIRRGGRRECDNPKAAYAAVSGRIPLERFLATVDVKIPALEEAWIVSRPEGTTKKTAKNEFDAATAGVIVRGTPVAVLAREGES